MAVVKVWPLPHEREQLDAVDITPQLQQVGDRAERLIALAEDRLQAYAGYEEYRRIEKLRKAALQEKVEIRERIIARAGGLYQWLLANDEETMVAQAKIDQARGLIDSQVPPLAPEHQWFRVLADLEEQLTFLIERKKLAFMQEKLGEVTDQTPFDPELDALRPRYERWIEYQRMEYQYKAEKAQEVDVAA